jgi:hypothetical protein
MDAPRVQEVLSSKPITAQAAHDLLSRFLEEERQDVVEAEENGDELLIRLEHVCQSLATSSSSSCETPTTTLASMIDEADDSKLDKKARKAAKKKAKKEKRKREKESSKKSKKRKTTS